MHYNLEKIGDRLRNERKKSGRSQDQLSDALGNLYSRKLIIDWEKGRTLPPLNVLCQLCEFYDCELGYLLCEYDCKTRQKEDISEVTGLSDESIQHTLSDMNNGQKKVLDAIIRTGGIEGIYGALYEWFHLTTYEGENPNPSDMQKDISEYVAEKYMGKVFDSLSTDDSIVEHFTIGIMEDYDLSNILHRASEALENNPIDISQAVNDMLNNPIDISQELSDAMNKRIFREDNKNS